MPARIADEREQRRGLILGLTLAESLLLLLFLMLLALASQIRHWQAEAETAQTGLEQLKPIQEALLKEGNIDIASVQTLTSRFKHLNDLETAVEQLRQQNETLTQQSDLFKSVGLDTPAKQSAFGAAIQKAAQINPSDPPAVLKRAMDVLDRIGSDTQPEQVLPLSQMKSDTDAAKTIAALQADKDKLKRDRDNLMRRNGNGLTYPSCWSTPTGQTEFMFDVTFTDTGVRVKDATPTRAQDVAWGKVASFPRVTDINEQTFVAATKKLAIWATEQQCKFYTRNIDATGPGNKRRYKLLQRTVEQNFYPYYPQSIVSPEPKPAAATVDAMAPPTEPVAAPSPPPALWNIFRN